MKLAYEAKIAGVQYVTVLDDDDNPLQYEVPLETCRYCQHPIIENAPGDWHATDATGDDEIWRETCPDNETFTAPHEPEGN